MTDRISPTIRRQALEEYLKDRSNSKSRNKLVEVNMWLVNCIGKPYRSISFIEYSDLASEGAIGLMEATCKFDPSIGVEFSTYAKFFVRKRMLRHINRTKGLMSVRSTNAIEIEYTMNKHGLSPKRPSSFALSIDHGGENGDETSLSNTLPSLSMSQEKRLINKDALHKMRHVAMQILDESKDPRNKIIAEKRLFSDQPVTLEHLGSLFNISKQAVEQKEKALISKIKQRFL